MARIIGSLAALMVACDASADVGVNKSFTPNTVSAGQTSTLTIVFLNPNPAAATGTSVTDTLPANVVVANPANATSSCGGTVTATPGAGSVTLTGATVPAAVGTTSGQCQMSVGVLSNTAGTYINTLPVNAVSSSQGGNTQAAQASLVATALSNITGTKVFSPAVVHAGGAASTMTITLSNPNGVALTNAAFTDAFPANLVLATPANLATTCAGGAVVAGGAANNSIALSGGTLPANGSCTITASVITNTPNTAINAARTNTIAAGAVTTAERVTNSVFSGNITVQSGAALAKAFAPTTITSGGTSTLTITVSNFNATALANVAFTDTFPGTMVVAASPAATTTCGGTLTATPGAGSVSITSGSVAAAPATAGASTCTIVVPVTATNTGASAQTLQNAIPAGTFGTVNYTAASGSLIVNPASPITGTKTYSPAPVQSGTTTSTVTLTNTTGAAATITAFTDNLTTLGAGFTVAPTGTPGGTCGATITAPVGGTLVTATGGTIPAGGSCTITFPILVAITTANGAHTNTIAAGAVQTTQGNNTLPITGVMDLGRAFTTTKVFAPATVQIGSTSTVTVTFTHNANAVALSNLSFTDTLPAGHTVASTPNASTTCGGTLTAAAGAGSFSLTGGTLGAGATSCTVNVTIQAPGTVGNATNSLAAGAVTTAEGATNALASAVLTRVNTSVTINKSFTPATVAVGGTSKLAIQIRNNNANAIQLTGLGLIDTLPLGMQVDAASPGLAFTGAGCTFTSISISTTFTLAGATINANSVCTLSVNMKATAAGNLIDNLPVGIVTSAQGVTNPAAAAATLASSGTAFLTITKTDGTSTATPGGATTYTVSVTNAGPNDVTGLSVDDTPPPGVTFTAWSCVATNGSQCTASGSGAIADTVTLLNGGTLTYTVNAAIAPGASGTLVNTATLGVPGSVVDTNTVTSATDTDTLVPVTALSLTKTDGAAVYVPGGTATYVVTLTDAGPSDALNVTLADSLPAGATLAGNVTCVAAAGASCGAVSGTTGATSFGATSAIVRAGGGSQLTFSVPVAFAAGMGAASITNTVTAVDTPSGASASASDTDTRAPQVTLTASKTDGSATYTPGSNATYTIVVGNAGVSSALAVTVSDALPAGVTVTASVGCVASAGSSCGAVSGASGSTSIAALGAAIAPGGSLTFTVPVHFASGMTAASITNTVSATDAASGASVSASDTDTRVAQVFLAVSKTDGSGTYTPGGSATYTIIVTNSGPSDALAVNVDDTLPAGATLAGNVTCAPAGGAACGAVAGASGASAFSATGAAVPSTAVASLTFTVPVTFAAGMTAASVTNTVTVTDTATGNTTSASDTDTRLAQVSLSASKSDGAATYTPGASATYVVTIGNAGPSSATDVTVADALPAGLVLSAAPTCVASTGSACGTVSGAIGGSSAGAVSAQIAPGGALTFSVPVRFSSALTAASVTNTVNASDAGSGAATSASDTDTLAAATGLVVTKSDGAATYTPGTSGAYLIVITNSGPSDATSVALADSLPPGVTLDAAASCVATGGAACGALNGSPGAGSITGSNASVPAGGLAQLTYTVPVAFGAGMSAASITNTVNVTDAPSGGAASATDTDSRASQVALSVTKTDGAATYTPGGTAVYTIIVTNAGPSDAASVTVSDALPAGVALTATPGCIATGNATCGTVSGAIGQTAFGATGARVGAGAGDALTFTVPVAFAAGLAIDPLVNTASATDLVTGNTATGSDTDARSLAVSLAVAKSDGSSTYVPGGTATYTVTVTNGGISDALDVMVTDALPAGVTLTGAVTCAARGNAACGTPSGSAGQSGFGTTGARVGAGAGDAIVFTAPVAFAPGLAADPLVNTADALDVPSGATGSGSDSNGRLAQVSLAVTKTDGQATYVPGGAATYLVQVANTGASDALDVTVSDGLPTGVTLDSAVTCTASGNASCGTIAGTPGQASFGATGARIAAGAGNGLTYSVPVRFAGSLLDDPLVNTAAATDQASGASGSGSDSDARLAQVGLTLTKSDGSATYTPGGGGIYSIILGNAGPTDARDVTLTDALPPGVALSGNVACVASGAAACGTLTGAVGATAFSLTGARVPAGGANVLTLTAPVSFGASMTADPLINAVQATDVPSGASVSATDSDALSSSVSLAVTKSDGSPTYTPGGTAVYTISVTNGGASDATAVTISDPLPPGVTLSAPASCVASGTSTCGSVSGAAGQASVIVTGAHVAAGAGNAVVLTVPVAFAAGLAANPLVNSASAIDGPSGAAGNGSDADALTAAPVLTLTKTDNASTYVPGGTATYVVTIGNVGLSNAGNVTMTDNLPAGVTLSAGATCVASGNAACGTLSGGAGAAAVTLAGGAIAAGGGNTLAISVPVHFDAAMVVDPLVNSASATATGGAPVAATDVDARAATVGLTLTKTDNKPSYSAGDEGTYVLTLGNAGPSDASAIVLTDPLPAGVSLRAGTTCVTVGVATCGTLSAPVGGSTMTMTGAAVSAGSGNRLIVSVPVRYAASLRADPLVNTATATAAGGGTVTATDSDTLAIAAALVVTKTDNRASYTPGTTGTYVVRVTNAGVSDATNVQVSDNLPAGVTLAGAPTCVASGAASCGTLKGSSGASAFVANGGAIPAGAGNALAYSLPVLFGSAMTADPLVNTAQVRADGGASAQASDSDARIAAVAPLDIPLDDPRTLLLLACMLALAGALASRRRRA